MEGLKKTMRNSVKASDLQPKSKSGISQTLSSSVVLTKPQCVLEIVGFCKCHIVRYLIFALSL
jgi:hypothetical protein